MIIANAKSSKGRNEEKNKLFLILKKKKKLIEKHKKNPTLFTHIYDIYKHN